MLEPSARSAPGPAPTLRPPPRRDRPKWRVPWDFGDILLFLVLYIAGSYLIALIASAPAWQTLGEHLMPGASGAERTAAGSLALQTGVYAVGLAVILILVLGRRHARLADLGWRLPRVLWIPAAVAAAALALVLLTLIADAIQALFPQAQNGQVSQVRGEYGHYLAFAIVAVSVVAPIVEETFFRGFVYGWMRRHLNVPTAALLSACFFALVHFQPVIFIPLAVLGVGLALLYEYSGSLLPGMIVHALFNLVEVIGILFPGRFP